MKTGVKKALLALLVLVSVVTSLALIVACGPPPKVTMRVAWWGNPTRDERTNKVIELYQKDFPNVTINPEFVSWAGYWEKINTQAAGNDLPDVMQHDYAYLLQFVSKNLMEDLTPYINSKKISLDGVSETYLSGGRVGGNLYGISLGTNAVCMVYDPAILAKAGITAPKNDWTWDDFVKIALEVYAKTKIQTLPIFYTDPKVGFENWIRQSGQSFYAKDGASLGFTDPALLEEFFNIQVQLLKAGAMVKPDVVYVNVTITEDQFSKGNSWVQYVWSNQIVATQAAAKKDLGIVMLPRIKNPTRAGTYLKPSMFFSVPKTSANKEEAAKFINYFLSNPAATKVLLAERGIPIINSVRDGIKTNVDPVTQQVFAFIDTVAKDGNSSPIDPPDPAAGAAEVLNAFRLTAQDIMFGKTSVKDGVAKFMKQANEILAKNKK
ncbi:MAG: extracellular solute-binding protein [Spirochaetaceae bacterium]|nr:MAG: extracellular solute-binding protein [Spirochaetaceae bacterium]